jgi:pimeloyl-ACP methyl ester carboxylesterase
VAARTRKTALIASSLAHLDDLFHHPGRWVGHDGGIENLFSPLFSPGDTREDRGGHQVPVVRLARHRIRLEDGHLVGVAIAGRGMPLVVAHGFTGEGVLYAQTLWRLVSMGFKVVAIDTAGHGRTPLPKREPFRLGSYIDVLERSLDHLGIRRAVFMGHSMGGRLALEVTGRTPERAVALVLLDAIAGKAWDRTVASWFRCPVGIATLVGRLTVDTLTTIPLTDWDQTAKLLSLMTRSAVQSIRPGRLIAPGLAILLAGDSASVLDRTAAAGVPGIVVHGAGDLGVPLAAARDAARRLHAPLVVVRGARHSWVLRDPETLPSIFADLLDSSLGEAWRAAVLRAGLDPGAATLTEIEAAMCEPRPLLAELTPPLQFVSRGPRRKPPTFRWTIEQAS